MTVGGVVVGNHLPHRWVRCCCSSARLDNVQEFALLGQRQVAHDTSEEQVEKLTGRDRFIFGFMTISPKI